jgi:RHS repeat-associated protein
MLKRGGRVYFIPPDGSTMEYYTHTTLERQTNIYGGLTGFIRSYASGAKDYYQYIPPHGIVLPDGNTPVFLSVRTDPLGRTNIVFAYDAPIVGSVRVLRLASVKDADGRVSTLSYTNADPSLITGVADPFGRTAILQYDNTGLLTNITDAAGLSSSFQYDSQNWVTNLTTPYGTTTFEHLDNGFATNNTIRAIRVVDAVGGTNIYMLCQYLPSLDFGSIPVPTGFGDIFDSGYLMYRESFHWGPRQAAGLPVDMTTFASSDFIKARMRHWLHGYNDCANNALISQTISLQLDPSPDGVNPGQATWYIYDGMNCAWHEGTNSLPSHVARVLPDGTTWYTAYQRDDWGRATNVTDTYSTGYDMTPLTRTRQYNYDGVNPDLLSVIGPQGETLAGYAYTNHLVLRATNAVGDVTYYTYDPQSRLTSVKTPAGLTRTNIYFAAGAYTNFVQTAIDLEINRTNTFTYTNNLVYTHTDERGLTTTSLYDALNRLTNSANSLGAIFYVYNRLDLVQVVDRLGFTTSFAYDPVRRRVAETNALGRATLYNYCSCGALDWMQDAAGNYTSFTYDNAGRLLSTVYPDSYGVTNQYDLLGELTNREDSAGISVTNWFNNQGQLYAVQDAGGLTSSLAFDVEDRVTNSWDASGVSTAMTYDNLGRLLSRSYPDGGVESFGYSARGLTVYSNQLGLATYYGYDAARRKTAETNANLEVTGFSYSPAGDLLSLTDGKNQTTRWNYDQYGRVTNKLDQASAEILRYAYDPDSRLTNRWSAAKGNTGYSYDHVGNLTNIAYPVSGTVKFAYDAMNRLTNMVDALGTTRYTYDAAGQLLSEGGLFTDDVLTNTYSNRRRIALALQTPTQFGETVAAWTNGFGWDLAGRLTNVTSPAGAFGCTYTALGSGFSGRLLQELHLPGGAYVTNYYDPVARLLGTLLENSGSSTLDSALYGYNAGNQRTAYTNAGGTYVLYTYDAIGQLTVVGSPVSSDRRGYAYDAAWNMNWQTNGGTLAYYVDVKNQLTNGNASGPMDYDANGNPTSQTNLFRSYEYDDENRLTAVQDYYLDEYGNPQGWRTEFEYDGLGRLRWRLEYVPATGFSRIRPLVSGSWSFDHAVEYLYDGWRVIQERNEGNTPIVSYTRGVDLSGSLEGAGGIGGLLARSTGSPSTNWTGHAYYHADGNGNITCLIDASQTVVARYGYDPFGAMTYQSGTNAVGYDNVYRFSSKEMHQSGMYYYGYRFYDPNLQRWINRDPIQEEDGPNLYNFVSNFPTTLVDLFGLAMVGRPVQHDPNPTTWHEFITDSSGYMRCWLKCMGLDLGLEGGAEAGGAEELGRRYYTYKYPRWFRAGGRYSRVLVPQFASRLTHLLLLKTVCEAAHCMDKCLQETSGADPDTGPYVPPYSGGPANAPPIIIIK